MLHNNKAIKAIQDYGLLLAACILLILECGFRSEYWANHFSAKGTALAWTISTLYSTTIALTCVALLVLTAKEFADGKKVAAWVGLGISVSTRGYIIWENIAISASDVHTLVFLQTLSAIIAVAEIRIALSSYADFRKAELERLETEAHNNAKRKAREKELAEMAPAEKNNAQLVQDYKLEYQRKNGVKPTQKQVAAALGVTDRTIRTWAATA